ncbi:MAG TPA: GNAT family N-acetyltransferase [Blastocatellia bacterium]|nr:GNAT family N-acetyltransferase [Blastocatellia bacterium]
MELNLGHFSIRNWQRGDEQSLVRHANNRKIWLNVRDRFPHPYTLAAADEWIKRATSDPACNDFAIAVDDIAVGGISIFLQTDIFRRSAEIGYWLGEEFWGRGIVTEAVRAMTEYAFSHFDICRIYAGVFEWNPASMRVLEKAGYEFEGRMKKSVTKEGQTIDECIYAIVRL